MGALFYNDTPDHPVFQTAKYKVGDRVKIVDIKITDPANYDPKTLATFKSCLGRKLHIKEIMAYETDDDTYWISYEFHIAHLNGEPNCKSYMESVYLSDDEIAPLCKRK
jgi:hypothetical protein